MLALNSEIQNNTVELTENITKNWNHHKYSNVIETRRGQMHQRSFLANFSVISDYILHLNFTDCFGEGGFALDSNHGLQTLSKPLLLFSNYTRTHIALANLVYPQFLQRRRVQALHHCATTTYQSFVESFPELFSNVFITQRVLKSQIELVILFEFNHTTIVSVTRISMCFITSTKHVNL